MNVAFLKFDTPYRFRGELLSIRLGQPPSFSASFVVGKICSTHVPHNMFFRHNVPIEQVACGLKSFSRQSSSLLGIHLCIFLFTFYAYLVSLKQSKSDSAIVRTQNSWADSNWDNSSSPELQLSSFSFPLVFLSFFLFFFFSATIFSIIKKICSL